MTLHEEISARWEARPIEGADPELDYSWQVTVEGGGLRLLATVSREIAGLVAAEHNALR